MYAPYPHPRPFERQLDRRLLLLLALFLMTGTVLGQNLLVVPITQPPLVSTSPKINQIFGHVPVVFVPNAGQTDSAVRFQGQGMGGMIFFTSQEVVLAIPEPLSTIGQQSANIPLPHFQQHRPLHTKAMPITSTVVRLQFDGAESNPNIIGMEKLPGVANYFMGNDPIKWHTNVPTFADVVYQHLYPGVDLRFEGTDGKFKGTYTVAPGGDPTRIRWRYSGISSVRIDGVTGNLLINLPTSATYPSGTNTGRILTEEAPVAWQIIDKRRVPVSTHYVINSDKSVGFAISTYDVTKPLILDPTLVYSFACGGAGDDWGNDIAVDNLGNIYVTGGTYSTNWPVINPVQGNFGGGTCGTAPNTYPCADGFVMKLNPKDGSVLYSTYFGGNNAESGYRIAIDTFGNSYVTGATHSTNFPTKNPLQAKCGDTQCFDAFVLKLNAQGNSLIYSTYLGGSHWEDNWGAGIAVDSSGNAYVAGDTDSSNFPTKNAFQGACNAGVVGCHFDVFLSKIDPTGNSLLYSTYLGGSSIQWNSGVAVDSAGNAYLTGYTESTNFPVKNAFQSKNGGSADAFVTKIDTTQVANASLVFSSYLGGSNSENYLSGDISADNTGIVYVTGSTGSTNFPVKNPVQAKNAGSSDVFVSKIDTTKIGALSLIYSTYLGSTDTDWGISISIDNAGSSYVIANTFSNSFPTKDPLQQNQNGGGSVLFKLSPNGDSLIYSTYLKDVASVAADNNGNAYVTGSVDNNRGEVCGIAPPTYACSDVWIAEIATATVPPITVSQFEITQGTQCLNNVNCFGQINSQWCPNNNCDNTVPLLRNKPTWMRIYVKSTSKNGITATGLLRGFDVNMKELPHSPLRFSGKGIVAHLNGGDRANANDTLNFELPVEWASQNKITVEAQVFPVEQSLTSDSKRTDVNFTDRSPLHVYSWRFRFPGGQVATAEDARNASTFMSQVYPINSDTIDMLDQGEFSILSQKMTWQSLVQQLAASCKNLKNNLHEPNAKCYGWVPRDVNITSDNRATYYGWTDLGVSVGYIYRPPIAGGQPNLAPQYIMAHEIGHTLPPVNHVATGSCGGSGGGSFDSQFPNSTGSIGEYGFWGNETEQLVYTPEPKPPTQNYRYSDLMSYCGVNDNHQWISPYTFRYLYDAIGAPALNQTTLSAPTSSQKYLIASGTISADGSINTIPFYSEDYPIGTDDLPGAGPYSIELQDAQGNVLFTRFFDQTVAELPSQGTPVQFFEILPFPSGTSRINIKHNTTSLTEISASPNAPQVTLLTPLSGQMLTGTVGLTWTGSDIDGDQLHYIVEYSADGGNTWRTIGFNMVGTTLAINFNDLPGTTQAKIRVLASDGLNTGIGESDPFTVVRKLPQVEIFSPKSGDIIIPGQWIHLSGVAEDREDGFMGGSALVWTLDGKSQIGIDRQLTLFDLPWGNHQITLTAKDSDGNTSSQSISVFVGYKTNIPLIYP